MKQLAAILLLGLGVGCSVIAAPRYAFNDMLAVATASEAAAGLYADLNPTAVWHPSSTLDGTDIYSGLTSTNYGDATITTNGWELDGTGDYVDMGFPTAIEIRTNQYTLSAWVHISGIQLGGIAGKAFAGAGDRWVIFERSTGNLRALVADGGSFVQADWATVPTTGVWYHVVMTHDPAGNHKIYVDGVERGSTIATGVSGDKTYTGDVTVPFRVGSYNDASGNPANYFKGYIDAVAVWNGTALTSNEVLSAYNEGR